MSENKALDDFYSDVIKIGNFDDFMTSDFDATKVAEDDTKKTPKPGGEYKKPDLEKAKEKAEEAEEAKEGMIPQQKLFHYPLDEIMKTSSFAEGLNKGLAATKYAWAPMAASIFIANMPGE